MSFYKIIRYFLFLLPPETAHKAVAKGLNFFNCLGLLKIVGNRKIKPVAINNLKFRNPIGVAAGFDKEGKLISAIDALGFGFIEVGTFTPKPQIGNPRPRLFRVQQLNALINRMGFNNVGLAQAARNIHSQSRSLILGISIGKNNDTPQENAIIDYLMGIEKMYPLADYLAVNISCPNVPNPSMFWGGDSFAQLLKAVKQKQNELTVTQKKYVPIFVKISPDLNEEAIVEFCKLMNASRLDGVIATNTSSNWRPQGAPLEVLKEKGGLSGEPIFPKMLEIIKILKIHLNPQITIIALGGINSSKKANQCFAAGADLIQLYTGLVYEGPGLIKQIIKGITP